MTGDGWVGVLGGGGWFQGGGTMDALREAPPMGQRMDTLGSGVGGGRGWYAGSRWGCFGELAGMFS